MNENNNKELSDRNLFVAHQTRLTKKYRVRWCSKSKSQSVLEVDKKVIKDAAQGGSAHWRWNSPVEARVSQEDPSRCRNRPALRGGGKAIRKVRFHLLSDL